MAYSAMFLRLFLYIFAARSYICATIDMSAEALKELKMLGINCPTPNEKMVAKHFIHRTHLDNAAKKNNETAILVKDRDKAIAPRDKLIEKENEVELRSLAKDLAGMKKEKEFAQKVHMRRSLHILVDSIEQVYESEYHVVMESYRRMLDLLKKEKEDLPGLITSLKNEIADPEIKAETKPSKETHLSSLEAKLKQLPQEIVQLENKLPPLISEINTRGNRIVKRKHMWKWIMENKKDEREVEKIWKYVKKWYDRQVEPFKQKYTISDYLNHFCENMGSIHEKSTVAAQALERIPLQPGYEFKIIPVYGDSGLDESLTILINAIGLSHFPDVTDLPHPQAITQKMSV